MPGRRSLGPILARWIGAVGLVLFGLLVLVPDEATAFLIADIGVALLITLALAAHLAFHRRWRRDNPSPSFRNDS